MQIAVQYARGGLPPCARRRVHDYIAAHLDQKITNDALAQIAGLSTTHFCAVFKQTEGMSPHRCVLQYRVRRTQQLLASTEMSLAEIADAVGFSNQSHCIQSFRKIVGVTPGDYRRCCLQDSVHSNGAFEVERNATTIPNCRPSPPRLVLKIDIRQAAARCDRAPRSKASCSSTDRGGGNGVEVNAVTAETTRNNI